MACVMCNGKMEPTALDLERSYKGYTIIIKGVKGYRCADCGEEFYQGEDVERIDTVLAAIAGEAEPEVLTLEEAAKLLRVSNTTLYGLVKQEKLPARRIGREWRFSKNALLEYLKGNKPGLL